MISIVALENFTEKYRINVLLKQAVSCDVGARITKIKI